MPAMQSWHALELLAPLAVENCPAVQAVQAALAASPVPVKKVPLEQNKQVLAIVAPLVVEYSPAPQAVHAALAPRPVPVK